MKIIRFLRNMTCLILLFCMCVCGGLLWQSTSDAREEMRFQESIASYKPQETTAQDDDSLGLKKINADLGANETPEKTVTNQNIIDLQGKYPDVLGWVTVKNTKIDHPFVQSRDNEDYLRADLDKNYLFAGTVFADCRCNISSSFLTILYGHNFPDGRMFGDISKFADNEFWKKNTTGALYLPHETYKLEIFAYLVVGSCDSEIYAPFMDTQKEVDEFQSYVSKNARKYRDVDLTVNDKVLVLSTCNYEYTGARSVLVLKMTKAK